MSYDTIVDWTGVGSLFLFLGMSIYITFQAFRPSRLAEMERMARLPIDCE